MRSPAGASGPGQGQQLRPRRTLDRYHYFRHGKYPIPNDDIEQNREDMKHAMVMELTDGKLYNAPIGANPQRMVDLGTGTGLWAIESTCAPLASRSLTGPSAHRRPLLQWGTDFRAPKSMGSTSLPSSQSGRQAPLASAAVCLR